MRRYLSTYNVVILVLLLVLAALAVKIAGPTGLERIALLEEQIAGQAIVADTILQRNQLMAERIQKIKSDDGQMEMLARYHFGMIKPNEVFIRTDH